MSQMKNYERPSTEAVAHTMEWDNSMRDKPDNFVGERATHLSLKLQSTPCLGPSNSFSWNEPWGKNTQILKPQAEKNYTLEILVE